MVVDKTRFEKTETIKALRVPISSLSVVRTHPRASGFIFARRGRKSIVSCESDPASFRLVLLKADPPAELLASENITTQEYEFKVDYSDFTTDEILRELLKCECDPPASFETVGHIAHMNLRDEFLPFKEVIGEVILDKNPHIQTVVTKVGMLSNEFRTFQMEIIASRDGCKSLVASVNERKMKLIVDYENCYWNSRLATERERLLKAFLETPAEKSRLIDMCCGVGALACFASREGLEVHANDLNLSAIACARKNAEQNRVDVEFSNMDAREFVRSLVRDGKLSEKKTNHVMVNLPEIGIKFLDVFNGLFESSEDCNGNEFRIYCHVFSRENPPTDIFVRIPLPISADMKLKNVHVRDVAPSKIMYSAEFTVPEDILIKKNSSDSKRPRLD